MVKIVEFEEFSVECLTGIDNYKDWKSVMENGFIIEDLSGVLQKDQNGVVEEKDQIKLKKAKSYLKHSIDLPIRSHINNIKEPIKIWEKLAQMYEERQVSGLCRKVELLRRLSSLSLSSCGNMQEYINKMVDYFNQLKDVNMDIPDDMKILFLLKGLDQEVWFPFILGLELINELKIDFVIQKLMNAYDWVSTKSNSQQVTKNNKKNPKFSKKDKTCFNCGKSDHFVNQCPETSSNKKKEPNRKKKSAF